MVISNLSLRAARDWFNRANAAADAALHYPVQDCVMPQKDNAHNRIKAAAAAGPPAASSPSKTAVSGEQLLRRRLLLPKPRHMICHVPAATAAAVTSMPHAGTHRDLRLAAAAMSAANMLLLAAGGAGT